MSYLNAQSVTKQDAMLSSLNRCSRCCVLYRPKLRGYELPFSADFYPDITNWDDSIPVQTSAESGAVAGSATNISTLPHVFGTPWGSSSTVTKKPMSTPFQGASGPSGQAGFGTTFGQPTVGGNHVAPKPVVISLQQISPEQSISHQLRRLTVRLLDNIFNLRTNGLFVGTSNPLKHCWHNTRYDSVPPTKHPPDRSEGAVYDKGTNRRFVEMAG